MRTFFKQKLMMLQKLDSVTTSAKLIQPPTLKRTFVKEQKIIIIFLNAGDRTLMNLFYFLLTFKLFS